MFRARPQRSVAVRIATWTVFGAVVVTAGTRLCLAWTSVAILVEKSLPDDAFYYFQIARHLAQGDGVTFDGLTATNGFHPLWLVLITPFFYLFPGNPELPIHLALALSYSGTPWPPLPFVLAVVALAVSDYKKDFALRRQLGQLNFMAAVLLALVLFHSSYRLYPRGWYFVPVAFLSALYLGVLLASLRRAAPRRSTTIASAVVVLVIAGINVVGFGTRWRTGLYPWQSEMLTAARWLGEHTDPSAKIGAFNAGIPAYWNPERTVINLDGVVNTDAFTAIRHRRLWAYIDHAQLTYVLDYQPYWLASPAEFSNAYGPYLGVSLPEHVSLVATIPGTLTASDIVIMKTNASRLMPEPALGIK
jgi:hypothetical protein